MDPYVYTVLESIITHGKFDLVKENVLPSSSTRSTTTTTAPLTNRSWKKKPKKPTTNVNQSLKNLTQKDVIYLLVQLLFLHYGYKPVSNVPASSLSSSSSSSSSGSKSTYISPLFKRLPTNVANFFAQNGIRLLDTQPKGTTKATVYHELRYAFPFFVPSSTSSSSSSSTSGGTKGTSTSRTPSTNRMSNVIPFSDSYPYVDLQFTSKGDWFTVNGSIVIPNDWDQKTNEIYPENYSAYPFERTIKLNTPISMRPDNWNTKEKLMNHGNKIVTTFLSPFQPLFTVLPSNRNVQDPLPRSPLQDYVGTGNKNTSGSTPSSTIVSSSNSTADTAKESKPSLLSLPTEVIHDIVSYIPIFNYGALDQVCTMFRPLVNDEKLWKSQFEKIIESCYRKVVEVPFPSKYYDYNVPNMKKVKVPRSKLYLKGNNNTDDDDDESDSSSSSESSTVNLLLINSNTEEMSKDISPLYTMLDDLIPTRMGIPLNDHMIPYIVTEFLHLLDEYPEVLPVKIDKQKEKEMVDNFMKKVTIIDDSNGATNVSSSSSLSSSSNRTSSRITPSTVATTKAMTSNVLSTDVLTFIKFLRERTEAIYSDSICFTRKSLRVIADEIYGCYSEVVDNAMEYAVGGIIDEDDESIDDDVRDEILSYMNSDEKPTWYDPDFTEIFGEYIGGTDDDSDDEDEDDDDDDDDDYDPYFNPFLRNDGYDHGDYHWHGNDFDDDDDDN